MLATLIMLARVGAASDAPAAVAAEGEAVAEAPIVIVGERVKRSLKDTSASVRPVTERELSAMAADRVDQVLAGIPNVVIGNGSEGPSIRGQNSTGVLQSLPAFLGGARPRATLEIDGRAAGFQEFVFGSAPLWDVHQIEVFRSPLTVTHGRNSIGGGIVISTNDPTYGWEGGGRAIVGSFGTRELSGVVSGPIAPDQLSFRLAGDIRHARTTVRLADVMRGANPNDDDYSFLRFKVLAEPRALPGFKAIAAVVRTHSQAAQDVLIAAPFRQRRYPFGGYGIFGVNVTAATVHASQQVASGQLEAIVSLGESRTRRFAEPSFGESRARLRDLSGDVFGSVKVGEGITLRGGIHALNSQFKQHIDLLNFFRPGIGDFRDHQRSFGAFAEAEVAVTERLNVSAGGRYQEDRQRRAGALVGPVTLPIDVDLRFSAWLPKLTATYAVSGRLKAGILVQRAYNPGGATLAAFDTGELDTFKAEHLWDYEAFIKGDFAGGRVTIAANIFYNAYTDAQRGVVVPLVAPDGELFFTYRLNNVPRSSTRGAEVELGWLPHRGLVLSAGVGLLRSRLASGQSTDGDIIGREFERAPHFTASASADWSPARRLRLSSQLRYHSGYFSDDFDSPELRVGSAALLDARVAYEVGKYTLFGYARNVLDSFIVNYRLDPTVVEAEDPRTFGIGIEARF